MKLLEERLLRYAAPVLYDRMIETFSSYHIHPYDVSATALKNENGYDVSLRFSTDFSQTFTHYFRFKQVKEPDEEVTRFFEEAAEKCKSSLIADYYKMMKL
ncbi:hypothetical protein [Bacillus sp. J33]|uniref:hypothetical protein n=1 Tax=Bacillus sp. J33 TaxID=935836 RepID=UPI000479383C|nr:hypothetical protein [Bacillus sp. J33]